LKRKKIKLETSRKQNKKKRIRKKYTFYYRAEELKDLKERKKLATRNKMK
jgi:hypothetical protein